MINSGLMTWQSWAFLSAVFAALTAIFAKVGVSDINSDMATLIRTVIILCVLALIVLPSLFGLLQAIARIRNTHYRISNQRIVIQYGVLSRSLEEIDLRSIDDIEFHQSFVERLFSIGDVFIVSTDKVVPKMALHGIGDPLKIRELIRSNAYRVSQRQLFTRST